MLTVKQLFANIILASVLAAALPGASVGCNVPTSTVKSDLQTAGNVTNTVAGPGCSWVSAVADDPTAGTICQEVLQLIGGGLNVASQAVRKGAATATGFKEVRLSDSGRLVGVLRPDAASALVAQLADKGVKAQVQQ